MTRKSRDIDVFQHIDMHGGDASVCWPWLGTIKEKKGDRRPYFTLGGKKQLAYRIVFNLMHPDEPLQDHEIVRHTCDFSICCNPAHLQRGTHQDNMDDMKSRERHGLTHHAVKSIKRLLHEGVHHAVIAKRFGVSRETVSAINQGRVYKDIEAEPGDNDDDNE